MTTPATETSTKVALTLHITTDSDRVPELVAALRLLGTVTEGAPDNVTHLPRRRTAPLRLDTAGRRVFWRGREVELTRLEFELLLYLATRPHRVHRRKALMTDVWHTAPIGERTVDVHVRRLRCKLAPGDEVIRTVRGVGYQISHPTLVQVD